MRLELLFKCCLCSLAWLGLSACTSWALNASDSISTPPEEPYTPAWMAPAPGATTHSGAQAFGVADPMVEAESESVSAIDAVIESYVDVLVQILPPRSHTLQLPLAEPLPPLLLQRLAEVGFGLQLIDGDQGPWPLRFEAEPVDSDVGRSVMDARMQIGHLELERRFHLDPGGQWLPLGALVLRGSNQQVQLDDRRFGASLLNDPLITRVAVEATDGKPLQQPRIALLDALVDSSISSLEQAPSERSLNSRRVEIRNLFYGNESAFADIWQNYDRLQHDTVVFGNDSLRLGEFGKSQLARLAERFDSRRDLFGLIGCSNGPTALDMGNEGLALGRAERVSAELQSHGIPGTQILDEGCWAPESGLSDYPGRGVVITHWRRRS